MLTAMERAALSLERKKALAAQSGRPVAEVVFGPCEVLRAPAWFDVAPGGYIDLVVTPLLVAVFADGDTEERCRIPLDRVARADAHPGGDGATLWLVAPEVTATTCKAVQACELSLGGAAPAAGAGCLQGALSVHHRLRQPLPVLIPRQPTPGPAGGAAPVPPPPEPAGEAEAVHAPAEARPPPAPAMPEEISTGLTRADALAAYREEMRRKDAVLVQEYYDALLAERKLRDPDHITTVVESLVAAAESCATAKEDWDLDFELQCITGIVADYWLEPHRTQLLLQVRERDPALRVVDLSYTGVDDDILSELLVRLPGSESTADTVRLLGPLHPPPSFLRPGATQLSGTRGCCTSATRSSRPHRRQPSARG
eukprot:TRINITY_DN18556_c0_g1_i2.p1 TRINITY_DN18556_c0_g1~~TRINITY_DN18556_c0_g1_i2.p1  ORF type:complete len:401 (+),score=70.76 TRINITY_DN18556_c0_g1_i2:94-1203(+)